jgi:hypothetical protein
MIDYQTYCQIRHLFLDKTLGLRQNRSPAPARFETPCAKWARREVFQRAPRPSARVVEIGGIRRIEATLIPVAQRELNGERNG